MVAWWSYESLDDRLVRRDRMMADPRWQAYLAKVKGLVEVPHVRFLRPTRFSPIREGAARFSAGPRCITQVRPRGSQAHALARTSG